MAPQEGQGFFTGRKGGGVKGWLVLPWSCMRENDPFGRFVLSGHHAW